MSIVGKKKGKEAMTTSIPSPRVVAEYGDFSLQHIAGYGYVVTVPSGYNANIFISGGFDERIHEVMYRADVVVTECIVRTESDVRKHNFQLGECVRAAQHFEHMLNSGIVLAR